jgi:hypothetical protein
MMKVAADKDNQVMWVKGYTDISPLTYHEWCEAKDMESGSVEKQKRGITYVFKPPFRLLREEEVLLVKVPNNCSLR